MGADLSALIQLETHLKAQGIDIDPSRVASALLGLARLRSWHEKSAALVEWLEQIAFEVLQVPSFGATPSRTATPQPPPMSPTLDELQERLRLNGVEADPRKVGSAVLGMAADDEWNTYPERMSIWLEHLAMAVAQG
jgi:hypothetical protein